MRISDPVTPDNVALMVDEPAPWLEAIPDPEIVATPALDEAQATSAVMSLLDPSLYSPVAANCSSWPKAIEGSNGAIRIAFSDRDGPARPGPKLPPPQAVSKLRHKNMA